MKPSGGASSPRPPSLLHSLLPWSSRSAALGKDGATAPSNRITVGAIGVGCMGRGHFRLLADNPRVQMVALADVDSWRRENETNALKAMYGKKTAQRRFQGIQGLQRLPRRPRQKRHRRRYRRHRRTLAPSHHRPRRGGRKRHLLRKADLPDDPPGPDHGRNGPATQRRLSDGAPTAEYAGVHEGFRVSPRRAHRRSEIGLRQQ